MAWPRRLILVRHAQSEGNLRTAEERAVYECATHAYELTALGREQARITGEYVEQTYGPSDFYYSSYYERARQTARIAFPHARIYEDARLAEANRGIFHTMTHAEIKQLFPKELDRKEREGLYQFRPLGGENWPDIELRIHSFLGTLTRDYAGQQGVIIVHGHWFILLQKLLDHFPYEEAEARYRAAVIENASVTVYEEKEIESKSRLVLASTNIVPWRGILSTAPSECA